MIKNQKRRVENNTDSFSHPEKEKSTLSQKICEKIKKGDKR